MNMSRRRSLISLGEQFNVTDLDGERTCISTLLRNVGCYYFRPDYLTYQADTTFQCPADMLPCAWFLLPACLPLPRNRFM